METPTKVFSSKISHTQSAYTQCRPVRENPPPSLMMLSGGGKTLCPLTWCRAGKETDSREEWERRSNWRSSSGQIFGKRWTHPPSSLPSSRKRRTFHTPMSTACFPDKNNIETVFAGLRRQNREKQAVDICVALECYVSSSLKENKSFYGISQS